MSLKLPQGNGTRVISGARAIFTFNGNLFGWASGVDGSEEVMYEPVEVLDNLAVREYVPVGYRVTFRCRIFRTVAVGVATDAKNNPGSLKEMGMFPRFSEILRLSGVDGLIQDEITGKTLFKIREAKTNRYDFSMTARGLVAQDVDFNAIKAEDESEITS